MSRWLVKGKKNQPTGDEPIGRSLGKLVEEYNLNEDLWRIEVPKSSPLT